MTESRLEIQELSKRCNEILILSTLSQGLRHGYRLALALEEESSGFFTFNHGTLYPILHKLEKDGLIRGEWKKEGPKRKRKLYELTDKGRAYLDAQRDAWQTFIQHFSSIVWE
ncbi:MAG: PadR family transcriptional regulator [Planctomycetota bacterium]|jgi:DNA-binding PadR family transcriptional regulator